MQRTRYAALGLVMSAWGCTPASAMKIQSVQAIAGGSLQTDVIEDSTGYFVYRYALANDASSSAPVASVLVDLADDRADAGTNSPLPATGVYVPRDITTLPPITHDEYLHVVPLGPVTPAGWGAHQTPFGEILWAEQDGYNFGLNSGVAAGGTLPGFGLRSPYLPGVRQVRLSPAYAALLLLDPSLETADATEVNDADFDLVVSAVLPTWKASELSHDLINQQLSDACGSLGWITNSGICNSLQVKLDEVAQALAANNSAAAAGGLMAFSEELDALGVRFISEEAYWMLKINAEALAEQLG